MIINLGLGRTPDSARPITIRSIISALKKADIVSVKFGTGGTTLNYPPDEIDLYKVYSAIEPNAMKKMIGIHPMPSPLCPVGKNIYKVLKNHTAKYVMIWR